jgi:hypothetical protein
VIDSSFWFGGGVANTHPILLDQVLSEFGGKRLQPRGAWPVVLVRHARIADTA